MKKEKKVHFIGIGGIGVSALAQYYLEKGHKVTGSDLTFSEITDLLRKKGAKIKIGRHKISNFHTRLRGTCSFPIFNQFSNSNFQLLDLVIYSPAVLPSNLELKQAKKLGIKCLSYPEALGELTKKYFTIAVSGSHGKSTTTSMISLVLIEAGFDPTVVVGTKIKEFGNTNFRAGKSRYLVIEADEWNASFLKYWPKIIVLTNIEREHLDYYKDLNHILKTFREYINHLPKDGVLVANADDENILRILNPKSQIPNSNQIPSPKFKIQNYSLNQPEAIRIKKILQVPGEHNISNALAALTVARILGVPDNISFKALSEYKGAWRRFDVSKKTIGGKKIILINDYGHHPTEIRATLKAAREKFPNKKIWCVFQPHQYQRTFNLFDDFVFAFRNAPIDEIIITDIYSVAGREKAAIKKKVNAKKLVKTIDKRNVTYLAKDKIIGYLTKNIKNGDIVILMGAGDIYDLNKEF